MRYLKLWALVLPGWLILGLTANRALAAPVDELRAAAAKEGSIDFYAPTTLTPQGAEALKDAFNKKYKLNIGLRYHPSGNMTRDVGKIVGMAATGVAPEWDLMVVTDAHHATLWLKKLLQPYDYKKLGIDPQAIHFDSGSVAFAHQIVLPAYNKKTVAAKDVPKRWEDLLDPKWKGGKIGMSTTTHHFSRLAAGPWGEEKTTKFVRALARQELSLGRLGEIYSRMLLGEVLLAATMTDSYTNRAEKEGAPIVHIDGIEPVVAPAYNAGVPKGAAHPNAGHLFALFLTTDEGQQLWEKYGGQTSAFVPGTSTYKYLHGKKAVFMTQDQAQKVDQLAVEYGKILGFGRGG